MKVAILGTGAIAHKMASTLLQMSDIELYAVASRTMQRAKTFSLQYQIPYYYDSYQDLTHNKNIDLIYIATPHSEHYENVKLCLNSRKNVLCEKPLTVNAMQAKELFQLAKDVNCLLAEAMWTRYMPSRFILEELLTQDLIGSVSSISANLGYPLCHVPRMTDPNLAGGALLDLAVYPIHFASMFVGYDIKQVTAVATKTKQGIDLKNSISITYHNGIVASINSDMAAYTDRRGTIFGSTGYLVFEPLNNCEQILHYDASHCLVHTYSIPAQISGYEHEIMSCKRAIENNLIECSEAPHKETLKAMELLDQIRAILGITFPCE